MVSSWLETPAKPLGVRMGNGTSGVPDLSLLPRSLVTAMDPLLRTLAALAGGLVRGKALGTGLPLPPTG